MNLPMLSRGLFHTGYAVRDVDAAIATLAAQFGVRDWKVVRLPEETGGRALAFAYVGDMMIELIDTVPGGVPIYADWIPQDETTLRLHHLGHFVDNRTEFDSVARHFEGLGIAMVIDDEMGDILHYRYFDTVALLGHYCEFVLMKPGGETFWADVPRN